ncbi:hypothetical protein QVD17_11244 [Tagetes erecta]|uniref:YTH domain-containing family protein n=1 Tax=Tagetes erecta TaxID=13708 RepID=A0AAD8NUR1_TARER|nr:hypothetical protein QVD17_11244 [Tagetes erecta]
MAAGNPPSDDAASLLKKLSLDPQTKSSETKDPVKKSSVDSGNGHIQPNKRALNPLVSDFMDPKSAYYHNGYPSTMYYYGGYDGATSDWDVYTGYMNSGSPDLAHGVYGYGYAPYGYGYPSYYQPLTPTGETTTPANADKGPLATDTNTTKGSVGSGVGSKGNTGSTFGKPRPYSASGMSTSTGYMDKLYPNKLYSQYGNLYQYGYGYGSNAYDSQTKGKPRVRANGLYGYNNEYNDGLNELNRGPRIRTAKNQKPFTPDALDVKGQNGISPSTDVVKNELIEVKEIKEVPDREQYNKADFPDTYADAKFFIIKSYSEDDVHKSIKYNVWASTPNGNKKLDAAYHEAQQKSEGCPVFLFFSVNTSGQFVGVAEMVGPVDFEKSLEYWQQDKWVGCFPVKWHFVKDVPNSLLRHIILEYNENKPVTNSRDTQEVRLVQGLQMVKVFKEHLSKQCILDDFEFYEDRQKRIQQKKAKQQLFQKQSLEGKLVNDRKIKEVAEGEVLKTVDGVLDLVNEVKVVDNVQDDAAKPAEMNVVVNGVANAC